MMAVQRAIVGFLVLLALSSAALDAAAGERRVGDRHLLRVHGPAVADARSFDVDALAALGAETMETETPWTLGTVRFVGVPLARLVAAVGAAGDTVHAVALNDYAVTFSLADAVAWGALVAFEADGRRLSVREKGPFWIVYPWSQGPALDAGSVQATSVWQLRELTIR